MAWAVPLPLGTIRNRGNYTYSQFVIPASLNATYVLWCGHAVSCFFPSCGDRCALNRLSQFTAGQQQENGV